MINITIIPITFGTKICYLLLLRLYSRFVRNNKREEKREREREREVKVNEFFLIYDVTYSFRRFAWKQISANINV